MGMVALPPGFSHEDYMRWSQTPAGQSYNAGVNRYATPGSVGPSHAPPADQLQAWRAQQPQQPQPQQQPPAGMMYGQQRQPSYYDRPRNQNTNFGYSMPQYRPRQSGNNAYRGAAWGNAANMNRGVQSQYGNFYSQAQRSDSANQLANQNFRMQRDANSMQRRDKGLQFGVGALAKLMG